MTDARRAPATLAVGDDALPAYLSGDEEAASFATRPTMDIARAGARRIATVIADVHAAAVAAPPLPAPYTSALAGMPTAGDWFPPVRRGPGSVTGGFLRMVDLPGVRLGAMLDEWWEVAAVDGLSTIDGRLRLGPPQRDRLGGFTITGRIRRLTRLHWTPVVVELWPRHGRWTMITMTPQSGVFTTGRYFRAGHSAIERLTRVLAATRAAGS